MRGSAVVLVMISGSFFSSTLETPTEAGFRDESDLFSISLAQCTRFL